MARDTERQIVKPKKPRVKGTIAPIEIESPYFGISNDDYHVEKRRLQIEMLNIQNWVVENNKRVAITFDGRDAAGKGSTIKRFTENMMSKHFRVVEFGVPTQKESKYWFPRYKKVMPKEGEIVFFDRSWYNRALIEPTMGYCKEWQYRYFMKKVLPWEHELIDEGLILIKFYLSVSPEIQAYRFQERLSDPLTFWKFSPNDDKARKKWNVFTNFKQQMFRKTSSPKSPWIYINGNKKRVSRLTCMLYFVNLMHDIRQTGQRFEPLQHGDKDQQLSMMINGVNFPHLSTQQYHALKEVLAR